MIDRNDKDIQSVYEKLNHDHSLLREQLLAQLAQRTPGQPGTPSRSIGEIIMTSNWTKLAAAAVVILTAGLGAYILLDGAVTPAYAIEQTLEANRSVRSIHISISPPEKGLGEAWATFDPNGQPLLIRMDFPETMDGPKKVVWEKDKARVWLVAKKALVVIEEPNVLARIKRQMDLFDPKVAMENFKRREADGKVKIETIEPEDKTQPVKMIVTTIPEPTNRFVALIDPETKLMTKFEKYKLEKGEYVLLFAHEYMGYNEPIDPKVWELDVPDDVTVIDQTTQVVGLEQGKLTKEEVVVEVVRQFFQALADEDYEAAGKLLEGVPEAWIKQKFGKVKVLRVISMGQPKRLEDKYGASGGAFSVPCKIEFEVEGKPFIKEMSPFVRQVQNHPQRWTIFGHI